MLLAAVEIPSAEGRVVVLAAEFEIMLVVGDQMGEDIFFLELARQHVVERFDRTPAAKKEIVPSGHELTPRGHARERTGPMVVEDHAVVGEALKRGRFDPVVAVSGEKVAAHGVEDDEEGFHADLR